MLEYLMIVAVFAVLFGVVIYYYAKIGKKDSKKSQRELVRGFLLISDGDIRGAITHFKEAARSDTENIDAYLVLGNLLSERGSWQEADRIFSSLLLRSNLPKAQSLRTIKAASENKLRAGQAEKALEYARKAREIEQTPRTLIPLIRAAEAVGNWQEAYSSRAELLKIDKKEDHKEILACYLMEQAKTKDPEEAKKLFHRAMELDTKNPFPYLYSGDLKRAMDDIDGAVKSWEELALRFPEVADLVFDRLEEAYYDKGEFNSTLTFYRQIAENDISKIPAKKALAEIYFKMGDWEKTIDTLKDIPESDPEATLLRIKIGEPLVDTAREIDRLKDILEKRGHVICTKCGNLTEEYSYRCPQCMSWNSLAKI